jgi:phosphoribosylaminoimidazole-succinocarboxamide synthase
MVVRKLQPLAIECVVRGYLAGSGWSSYAKSGSVCGIRLPPGLRQADRLPEPIFTPTTKAPKGTHDEPLDDARASAVVGEGVYRTVKETSLALYRFGHEKAKDAGMILADTKFEFGIDEHANRERMNGNIVVWIDEALTPDSSRFWPTDKYAVGSNPPSFDKQFVRDWLETTGWDKASTPPELPDEVVMKTREKYIEAFRTLTGAEPEL